MKHRKVKRTRRVIRKPMRRKRVTKNNISRSLVVRETNFSGFPPELRTKLKVQIDGVSVDQTNPIYFQYRLNGFGNGTATTQGCGPRVNMTGVYQTNYPSGHSIFCSSPQNLAVAGGPAIAPYAEYRVNSATFKYRVLPQGLSAVGTPSAIIRFFTMPLDYNQVNILLATPSTATFTQWCESPRARLWEIANPVPMGLAAGAAQYILSSAEGAIKWKTQKVNIAKLNGVPQSALKIENNWYGSYNGDTPNKTDMFFGIAGDNTNMFSATYQVQIIYDVTYFNRNNIGNSVNV